MCVPATVCLSVSTHSFRKIVLCVEDSYQKLCIHTNIRRQLIQLNTVAWCLLVAVVEVKVAAEIQLPTTVSPLNYWKVHVFCSLLTACVERHRTHPREPKATDLKKTWHYKVWKFAVGATGRAKLSQSLLRATQNVLRGQNETATVMWVHPCQL